MASGRFAERIEEDIVKSAVLQTAIGCVIGLMFSGAIRTSAVATSQTPAQAVSSQGSGAAGREGQPAAGRGRGLAFTEPSPLDFGDHEGYASIFDGKTLGGWDGNPKFWRVEDGAIVGESTPDRPSGNSYIAYRRLEAKDFIAKFEIKVEGTGGSGLQSEPTGLPWLANIPANVTAFNGRSTSIG
jgi:hypothetical protein